jgi:SAM-dependent methyltransferase
VSNCHICNTETTVKYKDTPYWVCPTCSAWFQYPKSQKVYEASQEKYLMSDHDKDINNNLAKWLWEKASVGNNKVLDIGSKYPYLSYCLKQLGANAFGMDNIERVPEYSKELAVPMIMANFEDWNPGLEHLSAYKLISMVHVFDHMYYPKAALLKIHELLQPDGILYIRSPANDVKGIDNNLKSVLPPYVYSLHSILELLVELKNKFIITYISDMDNVGQRDILLKRVEYKPTVFAGMIVKNEERDLPVLLDSISECVDGVVIVDTGSTDKTRDVVYNWKDKKDQIALMYTTYLDASEKNQNDEWILWDFSKARNHYIEKLESFSFADWVLWVDADDKILNPNYPI